MDRDRLFRIAAAAVISTAAMHAAITVDTTDPTDWKISNGILSVDWNSQAGRVFSMHLAGHAEDLIDVTNTSGGQPKGLYMDNTGVGAGTVTASYSQDGNRYVDWWSTTASNSTNPFTYSQHFVLRAKDPGIHVYFVVNHVPDDIAGSLGQIQFVFRTNLTLFPNTYAVNTGLGNLGATITPLEGPVLAGVTDPARQVQDATVDLHGLPLPAGYRREFYTKYDYSSYEYLHQAHGVYGADLAAWTLLPSRESLVGGPTKQDLIFTGNILIMECQSNHLDNGLPFPVTAGAPLNRLYGPFYFHFNQFDQHHTTPASLHREALAAAGTLDAFYDRETTLLASGYVASADRGSLLAFIPGAQSYALNQAWAVLSDDQTNFQYSHAGRQYWVNIKPSGLAAFHNVVPGTYRLSTYILGQWGESRTDGVQVDERRRAIVAANFTPENFGSAPPVWTLGTPDRSSHEFLHGEITQPIDLDPNYFDRYTARLGNSIQDDREYWGNWNYWADFAATGGAVIYYATAVGTTPATNDLSQWNYNQWHNFKPGEYGGYNCPAYAGNCATAAVPDWQVHFTTTSDQQAQGQYVALSVGLAATESDLTVSLNGRRLTWHGYGIKNADAAVRSGFTGTYQWVVFQWDASQLNPPGADNVITFSVNRTQGVMYDALRLEIVSQSAAHESTGWSDYEYLDSITYEAAQ